MRNLQFFGGAISLVFIFWVSACSDDSVQPPSVPPEPRDPHAIPTFINEWSIDGSSVAVDDKGLVYVIPFFGSEIQVYSPTGTLVEVWDPTPDNEEFLPKYLDFSNGHFIFSACGFPKPSRIAIFDNKRKFVREWFEKKNENAVPGGTDLLGIGTDGSVYTLDFNGEAVVKYGPDGGFEKKWATHGTNPDGNNWPSGIAIGPENTVYVSDTLHDRILKFSSDGDFISEFGTKGQDDENFNLPHGSGFDSDGLFYIADTYNFRIKKTDQSGKILGQFDAGEAGHPPFLVTVHGRHVYVVVGSRSDNSAILHFEYDE